MFEKDRDALCYEHSAIKAKYSATPLHFESFFGSCTLVFILSIYLPNVTATELSPPSPNQLPTGGVVQAGSAQINQTSNAMRIDQSSQRAVLNWQQFNVGQDASVEFIQPSEQAVILNRVEDTNPSQIFGQIKANGQVFLSNPSGVIFSPSASVDVGGLVATTGEIETEAFMNGETTFDLSNSTGAVINKGQLTAAEGGYIALLAPEVRNEGVIIAQAGTVALAAGDAVTLHFESGKHLTDITVTPAQIATLVENKHAILAPSGQIILSSRAAEELIGSVVQSGEISASSMVERGGQIFLEGDEISLTETSDIKATGTSGGDVLIGGDWQGSGTMHQATTVTMEQGATIDASATDNGDGGKVVLWSDITKADSVTEAHGEILARGGLNGGDGGEIETSGHTLNSENIIVNAGADNGKGGLWLLDPADSVINQTIANSYASTLNTGTSVENYVDGSITLNSGVSIAKTAGGDATLTFKVKNGGNILLDSGSSVTSTSGALNFILWRNDATGGGAGGNVYLNNANINTNGGHFRISGGSATTWNGLSVGSGSLNHWGNDHALSIYGGTTINTGVGDIYMSALNYYTASSFSSNNRGINIDNATINSTSGQIDITGNLRGKYTNGVGLNIGADAGNVTIESTIGAINLTGVGSDDAGTGNGWRHGFFLGASSAYDVTVKSTSGKITLDGSASFLNSATTDNSGLQFQNNTATSSINIVSSSGDIDLIGSNAEDTGTHNAAIRFTPQNVAGNLNIGYDGSNAYSGDILIQGNRIYQPSNQAGAGSIRVQSTGALTIESEDSTFSRTHIFDDDWNFGTTLSSLTIGKFGNLTDITLDAALDVAGNLNLYGSTINLNENISITNGDILAIANGDINLASNTSITTNGNSTLSFRASDNIFLNSGSSITSANNALNVVLWSRYSNAGQEGRVLLDNATIDTNGGHVWIGGGNNGGLFNGLDVGDGFAETYTKNIEGVRLDDSSTISTGIGNISISGRSNVTNTNNGISNRGILIEDSSLTTTSGNIEITGDIQGNYQYGTGLMLWADASTATLQTTTGNISLVGTGSNLANSPSGSKSALGILTRNTGTEVNIKTISGDITLNGSGTFGINGGFSGFSTGVTIKSNSDSSINVTSQSGDIDLLASSFLEGNNNENALRLLFDSTDSFYLGSNGVDPYSGNILIQADSIFKVNSTGGSMHLSSTGNLTIESEGSTFTKDIVFDNDWDFGTTLSSLTIGKLSNIANITLDTVLQIAGDLNLYGSTINLNENVSITNGDILAIASGDINLASNINYTSTNDRTLTLKAIGDIYLNSGKTINSSTAKLNTVFWGDSDGSLGDEIVLNGTINTNGGGLWVGGGAGSTTWTPYSGASAITVGDGAITTNADDTAGLTVVGANINTNGGNIKLWGRSNETGDADGLNQGIHIDNTSISSGAGSIDIIGELDGKYTNGVGLEIEADAGNVTIESTIGAINLTGVGSDAAGTANGWRHGMILVTAGAGDDITVKSTSGTITLDGSASFLNSATTDNSGLQFQNNTTTSSINIVSSSGDIDLIGSNAEDTGTFNAAIRFTPQNVAGNLNIGYDGINTYSGDILIQGNRVYQRTNHAGAGSIRVQSTGALTIESEDSTFSRTHTFNDDWNFGTALSSLTIGKLGNLADITLDTVLQIAGDLNLYGSTININENVSTSNGDILARASDDIILNSALTTTGTGVISLLAEDDIRGTASTSATTAGGDVLFSSDTDGSAGGSIHFKDNSDLTINTNGGNITLAGGDLNGSGYAQGKIGGAEPEGIRFNSGFTLNSSGGDIVLRGKSYAGTVPDNYGAWGVGAWNGTHIINSGTGTILIDGVSQSNGNGAYNQGVYFYGDSTTIQSANTSADAIRITGDASAAGTGNSYGIGFLATNTNIYATGTGGGITLEMKSGAGNDADFVGTGQIDILANGGDINLLGKASSGRMYLGDNTYLYLGSKSGSPVSTSSSDITLQFDDWAFGSGGRYIATTGDVTIQSFSDSFGQAVSTNWFSWNQNGHILNNFTLGKEDNTATVYVESDLTFTGDLIAYGGDVYLNNGLTATGAGDISLLASNDIKTTTAASVTTAGGNVLFASDIDATSGGQIYFNSGLSINSGGGDITLGGGNVAGSGYAQGGALPEGIRIDNGLTLNSSGGDIVLRGKSRAGAVGGGEGAWGVGIFQGTHLIDSGTGTILIDGVGQSSGSTYNQGVQFSGTSTTIQSANTTADAIKIIGDTSSATSGYTFGIGLDTNNTYIYATGAGGGITLDGYSGTSDISDLRIHNASILADSGPINLLGKRAGGQLYLYGQLYLGSKAGTPITTSSSDILVEFDKFNFAATPNVSTTGDFTWSSFSDSFAQQINTNFFNWNQNGQTVRNVTFGKTTNTDTIGIVSDLTATGSIKAYGGDIINYDARTYNLTGAGNFELYAKNDINLSTGATTIITNGGDVLFASNTDSSGGGAITLGAFTANTNGGDITIGGGATGIDFAQGEFSSTAPEHGVRFRNNTTLNSAGGDIAIRGRSGLLSNNSQSAWGIGFGRNNDTISIDSGAGTIYLHGIGQNQTNGAYSEGITFNGWNASSSGSVAITSANTGSNAITIIGDASASTASSALGRGLTFWSPNTSITATGNGGGITLEGYRGEVNNYAVQMAGGEILANGGAINIIGGQSDTFDIGSINLNNVVIGRKNGSSVTSSSSDITIVSDRFQANTDFYIDTTGHLTLAPFSNSFHSGSIGSQFDYAGSISSNVFIGSSGDADTINIRNYSSLGGLTLGKDGMTSSVRVHDSIDINGPINLFGAQIIVDSNLQTTGGDILLKSTGDISFAGSLNAGSNNVILESTGTVTQSAAIIANGLELLGTGDFTLNNTSNNVATLAANVGSISYVDGNELNIGTVNTSGVSSTGTINIATQTGDLTVSENITTTDTSSSAITLNAGKATSVGTSTGGNLIISGSPALTVGSGGRTTLYSGSISASTGLTTLVGSGSGRFRYNSDELASNFTTALGAGNYAIYREQPTLTITVSDETISYGSTLGSSTTFTSQNGDTTGHVLSTNATVAAGGSTSTSGNFVVGTHTLTASGAVEQLGYGITYANGTLTVNPKNITLSGVTASNRAYDQTTTATLNTSSAVFTGVISGDDVMFAAISGLFADENVGAGKTVTLSSSYAGADASNYTFTDQANTTADITARGLTVSGITAANRVYDGTTTASIDNSGLLLTGLLSGDNVTLSSSSGVFDNRNVGSGKTVNLTNAFSGADLSNYSIIDQTTTTANITALGLTISGITAANRVYDGTTTASIDNSGVVLTGLVSGDTVSLSSSTGVFDNRNVGSGKTVNLTNSFAGADLGNYSITDQTTTTANITALGLIISGITATNRVYDGTTVASIDNSGVVLAGLVSGDSVSLASSTGVFDNRNVGSSKTVTLTNSFAGADLGNYSITDQATTTADITALGLTISGITATNRVYDGTTTASIDNSGVVLTGLVSGDTVSLSSSTGVFDNRNVGVGKSVTLTNSYTGADLSNYSIIDQTTTTANITALGLTISGITAANRVYDGTTTASIDNSGVVLAGLVSGDTVSLASSTGVFDNRNVGSGKTVTLTNNYTGADLGNYSITDQATTTADITASGLTISGITVANRVYDGTTTALINSSSVILTGLISGDSVSLASSSGVFDNRNVGVGKTINLTNSYTGADLGNYSIIDQTLTTADITALGLTISGITAANRVYDGTTTASINTSGVVLTGLVSGDSVSLDSSSGAFDNRNVGVGKTVNLTNAFSGADLSNYSIIDQTTTTADITALGLTISGITAANRVYDGTTTASIDNSGVVLTGLVSGDSVSLSSSTGTFNDRNVGVGKTVNLSNAFSGADLSNYSITDQTTTTANITALGLTISGITAANRVYDGTTTASIDNSGVVLTGLVSGDTVSLSSSTGVFDNRNVGVGKTVNLTNAFSGADLSNYSIIDQTTTTANITALGLTISGITATNRVYDGTTVASIDNSGVVLAGLVSGDTVSLASSTGVFDNHNVGSGKTVTLTNNYTGADLGNYSIIDQTTTTANITALGLTISGITATNRVYDGTTVASIDNSGVVLAGLVSGDTVSLASSTGVFDNRNVGSSKTVTLTNNYTGADLGNYSITDQATTTADITALGLTISGITATNRVYDGTTTVSINSSGVVLAGLVSGDTVSLASSIGVFDNRNVGAGKTVNLTNAFSGADLSNYSIIDQTTTTANITALGLTISGITATNRVYDGTTAVSINSSGVVLTGLVSGDSVSLSSSTGVFDNRNVGSGKTVNLTNSFAGADLGNYSITDQTTTTANITALGLTISGITATNRVYDGTTTVSIDSSGVVLTGLVSGDSVSLSSSSGVFDNRNVGSGKTVNLTNNYTGADLGNYSITDQTTTTANITALGLTISGITAANRVYDGTTTASIDNSGVVLAGLVSGDSVSLSTSTGAFDNRNVGSSKTVNLTNSYTGADLGNYSIIDQATTTANITALGLTISGITATNRVYDGTTTASIDSSGVVLTGLVSGDTVSLSSSTGAFNDRNVGVGKTVNLTNAFSGADLSNYSITDQTTTTADITALGLTISGLTAANRVYDGTTTVSINSSGVVLTGLVSGDSVSLSSSTGAFNDRNVGIGKTVNLTNTFSGADLGNYSITDQVTTSADITARGITVSGISANDRVYDGTTTASINSSGVVLTGLVSGDSVSLATSSGGFNDRNVGVGKTVTLTNSYTGADLGNYSIIDQATTTADITALGLTISGITAANRIYDGTTAASIDSSGLVLTGLVSGDSVSLSSSTGTFNNRNVGVGKTVTLTNSYTGADLGNYSITDQTLTTAGISARGLTVSGITAVNRVYDGTTDALTNTNGVSLAGLISGDSVSISSSTGVFDNRNVGVDKNVTLTNIFSGSDLSNYNITDQVATTAEITRAHLTIQAQVSSKVFDGNTSVQTSPMMTGLVAGDDVSNLTQSYLNADVGENKTVSVNSGYLIDDGNGGNNYLVTLLDNLVSEITDRIVAVTPESEIEPFDFVLPIDLVFFSGAPQFSERTGVAHQLQFCSGRKSENIWCGL